VPTYVYACRDCDDRLEVFQRMSEAPLSECGKCGGNLRRVLFPPAVIYKGSGFYTTDYKNGGRKEESSGAGDSAPSTDKAAAEAKTEAKTDTKADTKTSA
jgi:putative FmdB family regulatory protein